MMRKLKRKFKAWFFVMRLHYLVPGHILNFIGHLGYLSRFIQKNKNKGYTDFYTGNFDFNKRNELFEHVASTEDVNNGIDYLEFGVASGKSFRWWANRLDHADNRFYGFDTFTGLPEAWGPFKAGAMSNGNKIPEIDDDRTTFFQGLFQQTLLPFLANYDGDKRKIIHMDADLYSATLYVLTLMTPYLKKGDIIFFDEFNVPQHEFKAFREWTNSFYIEYEVLGNVNNFYQLAVKIV